MADWNSNANDEKGERMLKAKKLFLSIMVVSIFVIGIFSLTSCNKGDDSGKIIDKENFSTIKNDYQLYKESKPQVMPEGEDIVIDGANYDINGVTTDKHYWNRRF